MAYLPLCIFSIFTLIMPSKANQFNKNWLAFMYLPNHSGAAAGELTGFFPRIDRIFPSSASKRYSKGWGLGFRAENLGVD